MRIHACRIGPARRHILDRVLTIADSAAGLVERQTGISLHNVDLLVTDTYFTRLIAGERDGDLYGCTTYGLDRIIAVINAEFCGNFSTPTVDRTVIHELVHGAQMSKPGIRRREKHRTHDSYARLQGAALSLHRTRWNADEAEAEHLEHLAVQLDDTAPSGGPIREFHRTHISALI